MRSFETNSPLTWIVERTFARLSQKSSLEQRLRVEGPNFEVFIDLAAIRLMLKQLASEVKLLKHPLKE